MAWRARALPLGNPAAGAGFSETFATDQASKMRGLQFTFTTDATVANRLVTVSLADPNGNVAFQASANAVQAASAVVTYQVSDAYGTPFTSAGVAGIGWPDIWLPAGWKVSVTAALEDTGDQFSAIIALVEYGWPKWEKENVLEAVQEIAGGAQAAYS